MSDQTRERDAFTHLAEDSMEVSEEVTQAENDLAIFPDSPLIVKQAKKSLRAARKRENEYNKTLHELWNNIRESDLEAYERARDAIPDRLPRLDYSAYEWKRRRNNKKGSGE